MKTKQATRNTAGGSGAATRTTRHGAVWPVLRRYDSEHLTRIALPLGGIGTGTVSLGGRGDLRDWEIVNRPAKGFSPLHSFFALWARPAGDAAVTRALEGPIDPVLYEGGFGCALPGHNLPRFRQCEFRAAYPFGQVLLSDRDVPLDVRLEAFNPFIPGDAQRSGIPVAVLRFALANKTAKTVDAAICGSLQNFIGHDGTNGAPKGNRNTFRAGRRVRGVFLESCGVDASAEQWGTLALTTTATSGITQRTAWAQLSWGDSLLDFWDDFSADGRLNERDIGSTDAPQASLCVRVRIAPRAVQTITFLLTWHFPNRMTWSPAPKPEGDAGAANACCEGSGSCSPNADCIGNFYTAQYADAWDVAEQVAPALPRLESDTLQFVRAFCTSDLPDSVKEAALFNLSTLRSQTCFRTPDGNFYGWEGCGDRTGCCDGSCTHVWNYEQATAYLFGDLARRMREVEFLHATDEQGKMSFRIHLPLGRARNWPTAAADGQMGCLMKLLRDWRLSGDDAMLRRLWPHARRALEFCWIEGGWDADRDGVMEGCQHNTMDVEYFGPNPQMGAWYLGALRAAEEMARYLGEDDFAATCHELFARGSRWMDGHLFNGDYYEHEIRPPQDASAQDASAQGASAQGASAQGASAIAPGLRHESMGARDLSDPELQLGAGCLVDQLVGQYMAHVCGLGYLLDPHHVRAALRAVMKHNFKTDLSAHFNHMRSFALGEEAALLMCTYPRGRRPKRPFPYCNEVMTGFEYTAAAGMIYEGQTANGLKCIEAIRARYDGHKRSPFDEAECGHHYARAMASWAAVLALSGFDYSGVEGTLQFAAAEKPAQMFWSNGQAWGTCRQKPLRDSIEVRLDVLHGTLEIKKLVLGGAGAVELPRARSIGQGRSALFRVQREK